MKRLVIAGLAAVTLAAPFAGAAQAQPRGGYIQAPYGQRWESIEFRVDRLEARIDRGVQRGDLTRREARRLRRDLNGLVQLQQEYSYSGRGLDWRERADLDRRFDYLAQRVRFERRDGEDRPGRWHDHDGRDSDRDGRDYDRWQGRDGRDTGYEGRRD